MGSVAWRRLAREQPDDAAADESPPELFAQILAEAATTWRSPATADRFAETISTGG